MTHRAQSLRVPVQLMGPKTEGAQCSAVDRIAADPGNAHRPPRGHPYPHSASLGTQGAERLLHFHRTTRGLRYPLPVLGPDGNVIQQLPGYRGDDQTRGRSRTPYQQISSGELHTPRFRVRDIPVRGILRFAQIAWIRSGERPYSKTDGIVVLRSSFCLIGENPSILTFLSRNLLHSWQPRQPTWAWRRRWQSSQSLMLMP